MKRPLMLLMRCLAAIRYPIILGLLVGSWLICNGRMNDIAANVGTGLHDSSRLEEISRLDGDLSRFYTAARQYAAGDPVAWVANVRSRLDQVTRRVADIRSGGYADILAAAPHGSVINALSDNLPRYTAAVGQLARGNPDTYKAVQDIEFALSPRVKSLTEWADAQRRERADMNIARDAATLAQVGGIQREILLLLGAVMLYVAMELAMHWRANRKLANLVEAKRQAMRVDHLTGISNRMIFEEALAECIGEPNVNVIYFDLDGFKKVNDWLGHEIGDKLLCRVAAILDSHRGSADIVARFGGDEFAALLRDGNPEQFADTVIREISEIGDIAGNAIAITASAGICARSALGRQASAGDMMRNADLALYACKHQGRNQFLFCSAALLAKHDRKLRLEADIETAIQSSTVEVAFQPIMEVATNRITAIEALVRWHHPEYGMVPALEICELARSSGQMPDLALYVMDASCRFLANAAFLDRSFRVAVNLSPDLLSRHDFPDLLVEVAARWSVDPERIVLEITEQAADLDAVEVARSVAMLRRLGFRLALDDFGAGQSNLVRLSEMDFSTLKFDKSLIDNIAVSGKSASIVEAVSRLASDIAMETVAEGVETPGQLQALRAFGITYAQGYLISRPLSAIAALQFLVNAQMPLDSPAAPESAKRLAIG